MYTGIGNSGHVAKPTLKNGLVWYWDLAESLATITDQHSGLALTRSGTINTLIDGAPDSGSCVEIPSASTGTDVFRNTSVASQVFYRDTYSVNIWVMNYSLSGTYNTHIAHRAIAANGDYFSLYSNATGNGMIYYNSVPTEFAVAFTARPLNTWIMITMVRHSYQFDLYINAEQVSQTGLFTGTTGVNAAPFSIGNASWTPQASFQHRGRLFGAGVWGRALKNPEIVALYNSGFGRRYENL